MPLHDDDDWVSQRLAALRPGWRGRLTFAAPEQRASDATASLVGTIVDEPTAEVEPESGVILDAVLTLVANFREGRFVRLDGEPRVPVRLSRIVDAEPM